MLVVDWQAATRKFEPATHAASLRERGLALGDALPALLVPVQIVGDACADAFSASEAGAMAVVCAFVFGKLAYRRFQWRDARGRLLNCVGSLLPLRSKVSVCCMGRSTIASRASTCSEGMAETCGLGACLSSHRCGAARRPGIADAGQDAHEYPPPILRTPRSP